MKPDQNRMNTWEEKVLRQPGAPERVHEIEEELRLAVLRKKNLVRLWRRRLVSAAVVIAAAGTLGAASLSGASTPSYYGQWANGLPTSSSFFPIAVFDQSPSGGDVPAPSTNQAQQMKAEGINLNLGSDSGSIAANIAAACAAQVYDFAGINVRASGATGLSNGPAILSAIQAAGACGKYTVGYQAGDEGCNSTPASVIPPLHAMDPTRMANWGQSGGFPGPLPCAASANASDLFSGDVYEITNPWIGSTCLVPGKQSDCLWGYGVQTQRMVAAAIGGRPVFVDLDSGANNLGFSSQNSSVCNSSTNLCSRGNEQRATPEQVNSAAWLTLINGANGLLYFCDDGVTSPDACLGGGSMGNVSACAPTCGIPANLSYIDSVVKGFAQELNSPNVGGVSFTSSNGAVPINEMTKTVGGTTYLFTEADRGTGTTTATYSVAGAAGETATLLYDSAARYNPSLSEQGRTFTLDGSGSFSDSLTGDTGNAAGALSYQVKIYALAATGATTTSTTAPATTTTTVPATTTTVPPGTTVTCTGTYQASGSWTLVCKP